MQTKERIIKITFDLLLQKGYDGVSISDIQKATGLARGLLYHYFGNKEALFIEASSHHFNEFFMINLKEVEKHNVEQTIHFLVEKYQKLIQNMLKDISIIHYDFLFYRIMQQSKEFAANYEKTRNQELEVWKIALANSSIRDGLDIDKIAQQFVITTDGVWLRAVTPNTKIDLIETLNESLVTLYNLIKR